MAGIDLKTYRDGDDLLTGGLGEAGLRALTPPACADPANPTREERRRRAIWANWRGIADLAPGGGFGEFYGSLGPVPGREYQALKRLPNAKQPHRVMLQLPDNFDTAKRCVVVSASSGSRGIYGAIALSGGWGLPRGCAVAYTDKGAGTDYFDVASDTGVALDGSRHARGDGALAFEPPKSDDESTDIAVQHAHSGDNPEADWGRHLKSAAEFALEALELALPDQGPFTFDNTRVIAVGVSNGGGSVLRAAGLDGDWLDGVVAISPNIWAGEGGRPLYDYATEAGLFMSCALLADEFAALWPDGAPPAMAARCQSLVDAGLLQGDVSKAPAQALAYMRERGWSDDAIRTGAMDVQFDLWRAVAVTYASSYARTGHARMPCGYRFSALDGEGQSTVADASMRAAWWSDASGIPPGAGVQIIDSMADPTSADAHFAGLQCLRELWTDGATVGTTLRRSVDATRASLPREGLPVFVIHGAVDGLIPESFTGGPYVRWAQRAGCDVRYWRVDHAQHFDAFLGLPVFGSQYVPLMPYAYRALDAMWAHVADAEPLPDSANIAAKPRGLDDGKLPPLTPKHLAMPD
ncbi:MAG: hydrogenase [Xanthomonadales bacterium]|nr:hydrogenase [Xanthomonadales bacterium]